MGTYCSWSTPDVAVSEHPEELQDIQSKQPHLHLQEAVISNRVLAAYVTSENNDKYFNKLEVETAYIPSCKMEKELIYFAKWESG